MKLVRPEINYFEEVGRIVRAIEKIKALGMCVYFDKDGMRISETYGKGAKDPFYETSDELFAFLNGLEDGFWHAIRVDKALFTDSKFTDPKIMKEKPSKDGDR